MKIRKTLKLLSGWLWRFFSCKKGQHGDEHTYTINCNKIKLIAKDKPVEVDDLRVAVEKKKHRSFCDCIIAKAPLASVPSLSPANCPQATLQCHHVPGPLDASDFLIRNGLCKCFFNPFKPSISLHRPTTFEATQSVIAEIFKNRWEWLKLRSRLYKPWASHILLHLQTTTNKTCTSLLCFAVFESSPQTHLIIWHQRYLCQAFWWINPGSVASTGKDGAEAFHGLWALESGKLFWKNREKTTNQKPLPMNSLQS